MNFNDDTDSELIEAVERLKKAEMAAKRAREYIQGRMGAMEELTAGCHTVTWKWVKGRMSTNWKAIAAKLDAPAEMIDNHTTTGEPTRRFVVR